MLVNSLNCILNIIFIKNNKHNIIVLILANGVRLCLGYFLRWWIKLYNTTTYVIYTWKIYFTTCETYKVYLYVLIHRPNIVREHVLLCVHNKSVESLHWDLSNTINYNIHTYNHQSGRLSYGRQRRVGTTEA